MCMKGWVERALTRAGVLFVVVAAGAALLSVAPAGAAGGGSIGGTVTTSDGGAALPGVCVSVSPPVVDPVVTDADGAYVLTGIDDGSYAVHYEDCSSEPAHAGQWYLGRDDEASADLVTVADGGSVSLENVKLAAIDRGTHVSGTVTDAGGQPVAGVPVGVVSLSGGQSAWTSTGEDGTYRTDGLPAGEYRVEFDVGSPSGSPYAPQYWKQAVSWNTADVLSVPEGPGEVTGIDAQLTAAASVAGRVTDLGAVPIDAMCVHAFTVSGGSWNWIAGASTAPDGTYTLTRLPAVDVRVQFGGCGGTSPYVGQWYANAASPDASTPIVLAAGDARTGVDAQLSTGIGVSGRVTAPDGAPIAGVDVWVSPTGTGAGAGAQTAEDGTFTTGAVAPGDYRVQFSANGPDSVWATQYWDGQWTWSDATVLTVTEADVPLRSGVDAVLVRAATVTGIVTGSDGLPAAGTCVNAVVTRPGGGYDGVGNASVAADGTYRLTGLPPVPMTVVFQSCADDGAWVAEWWNDRPSPELADFFTPLPGETTAGVDAQLAAPATIRGQVRGATGEPLAGICVQATADGWFGGLARTNEAGDYFLHVARVGTYRVQFVDCNDVPVWAAEWWDDARTASDATVIALSPGDFVDGVDATLAPGETGTIRGVLQDVAGRPMVGACIVAYLPDQYARFVPVAADGTYEVADLPSGTFALAALGCGEGEEPSPVVQSATPGIAYTAQWWDGVTLDLTQADSGGPDPIAQGAQLVTVTPGADLGAHDFCFGCDAVDIDAMVGGDGSIAVEFTVHDLVEPAGPSASAVATDAITDSLDYAASCTSSDGISGRATGTGVKALTVGGLTPGATYTCTVTAEDAGVVVAASERSGEVTLSGEAPLIGEVVDGTVATLAFTGRENLSTVLLVALAMVVLGGLALLGRSTLTRTHRGSRPS